MTSIGLWAGCAFIAVWNIISFVLEYGALHLVYRSTAALNAPRKKKPVAVEEPPLPLDTGDVAPTVHIHTTISIRSKPFTASNERTAITPSARNKKNARHGIRVVDLHQAGFCIRCICTSAAVPNSIRAGRHHDWVCIRTGEWMDT
jgi:hypothetical protein